ncbi:hypothetical protein SRA_09783 [Streptococcus ratti FA-1 = DSM 20564]|uniref:Uncharacterized protein n=1 Tax=Streptococcus ratti FA-1 = DSM 20564 TaxID=699248 RepID=A0ABP2QVT4_STRRT|nr:hypothetical protein SRA_09783 [Streptococcus ratti FA-1 = DSM 20564]
MVNFIYLFSYADILFKTLFLVGGIANSLLFLFYITVKLIYLYS